MPSPIRLLFAGFPAGSGKTVFSMSKDYAQQSLELHEQWRGKIEVQEGKYHQVRRMLASRGLPEDARMKLKQTLTRIINENSGGLICIIL